MPGALCPQYTYDGWSGVPRLENNEPPLLQLYSNPKKAKLTVEVGPAFWLSPSASAHDSAMLPRYWLKDFMQLSVHMVRCGGAMCA